jgi:hypothetical protein
MNQTNFKDINADDNDFFLTDDQWRDIQICVNSNTRDCNYNEMYLFEGIYKKGQEAL